MRPLLLLPFLGSVWAAPTESATSDPQLDPRATAQNQIRLDVTSCTVRIDGWNGFNFKAMKHEGTLVITQGIPSPGTKNGQNIYDMSLNTRYQAQSGSIQFNTNSYLSNFPIPGRSVNEYAKVSRTPTGGIKADIDLSLTPGVYPPLRFMAEMWKPGSGGWLPAVNYIPTAGWLNVVITGREVTGWLWLEGGINLDNRNAVPGRYYAPVTGWCVNSTMPFVPPS